MKNIRALKQPRRKSHKVISDILLEALEESRKDKVTGIAVIMTYADQTSYTDYGFAKGGSLTNMAAGAEKIKLKVMKEWMEQ